MFVSDGKMKGEKKRKEGRKKDQAARRLKCSWVRTADALSPRERGKL
jgi:hypothetical protein